MKKITLLLALLGLMQGQYIMLMDNKVFTAKTNVFTARKPKLHQDATDGDVSKIHEIMSRAEVDINQKDFFENTALHYAKNADTVRVLLEYGANKNHKQMIGATPLAFAANIGSVSALEALLQNEVDVNMANEFGITPLHYAAGQKEPDLDKIKLLLTYGARINAQCYNKKTPFDDAFFIEFWMENHHESNTQKLKAAIELLRSNGAKTSIELFSTLEGAKTLDELKQQGGSGAQSSGF